MTLYYKMRQILLQSATEVYYKMRQLLQITMFLLQNATVITNCSSTMCNIANLFDTNIRKLDVKKQFLP